MDEYQGGNDTDYGSANTEDDTSGSYDDGSTYSSGSSSDSFDVGIVDGQEVDVNGDGIADGVAQVSYDDLDGDGIDDHATVTVSADTDGDGVVDTVVIMDQYDVDQDGYGDAVDVTYGVDSDGDGEVDESTYASGTVTNTPTDTDGDGVDDTMVQTFEWDGADSASSGSGAETVSQVTSEYDEDVANAAYVDPQTGEWVEPQGTK